MGLDPRTDAQTGLPNALAFVERLWTAAAGAGQVSLLLLDIDGLARLNAQEGVAVGDRTILALADLLRERADLLPYRFGGDAFAVLARNSGAVAALAEDLVESYARAVADLGVSCTIGYTETVAPFDVGSILWRAERALRTGKAGGGGRVAACVHADQEEHGADVIGNLVRRLVEALRHLEDLQSQALTDPISGLPNHRHAHTVLESALRQAEGGRGPVSIIFLDGDRLRRYNERGYEEGNAMIRRLGAVLRDAVGESGFVGRWLSGDEFLVVLPGVDGSRALRMAEDLCAAVAGATAGWAIPVTVSAGVAEHPADGGNVPALLRTAYAACAGAKVGGGGQAVRAGASGAVPGAS